MSSQQLVGFRMILEGFTNSADIIAPEGVADKKLVEMRLVMAENGYSLPEELRQFLSEINGFIWNGIEFFGAPKSSGVDSINLLNAQSRLDPANEIGKDKLIIGRDETYLYFHDQKTSTYQRAGWPEYHPDSEIVWESLSSLLVSLMTDKNRNPNFQSRPTMHGLS